MHDRRVAVHHLALPIAVGSLNPFLNVVLSFRQKNISVTWWRYWWSLHLNGSESYFSPGRQQIFVIFALRGEMTSYPVSPLTSNKNWTLVVLERTMPLREVTDEHPKTSDSCSSINVIRQKKSTQQWLGWDGLRVRDFGAMTRSYVWPRRWARVTSSDRRTKNKPNIEGFPWRIYLWLA